MDKKIIGIMLGIVGVVLIGAAVFLILSGNDKTDDSGDASIVNNNGEEIKMDGKILVAYYSAQNHTKAVAEAIASKLNADVFEIVPQEIYTAEDLDWTNDNSRVSREHNDESLRNVLLEEVTPDNWAEYDTVLIGYPIWWGIAAWPVDNFVKGNTFADKTVIPFCTSASSGLGQSAELLKQMASDGNWQAGYRFSSNPTDSEIESWLSGLAK